MNLRMPDEISHAEREMAREVADRAMLVGWERAIGWKASELGVSDLRIRDLLNKAAKYNEKADPAGRIPELEDWEVEKRGRSELASARGAGKSPTSY